MSENNEKQFTVHNVYVKDLSFESPKAPHVFSKDWLPRLNFDLAMNTNKIEDSVYEVNVKVTLDVKLPKQGGVAANDDVKDEDLEVVFLVELEQSGIFFVKGLSEDELDVVLSIRAPEILFPYAREAISSLASRGGFPQIVLPPVNFEGMYLDHKARQEQESPEESLVD